MLWLVALMFPQQRKPSWKEDKSVAFLGEEKCYVPRVLHVLWLGTISIQHMKKVFAYIFLN